MINPGTQPVVNATEERAAANMQAFAEAVAEVVADDDIVVETPHRDADSDSGDGRYGYTVSTADGASVHILMPGAPLAAVRDDRSPAAPCLAVNGTWWWWPSAVTMAVAALRG